MNKLLETSMAAAVLALAASVPLGIHLAFAEPDSEQEATMALVDQEEPMTDADALAAASSVPDAATQGDAVSIGKEAKKPEKTGKQADASIPSANPDDANRHTAWRKREANKAKSELQNIRRSMMQQGSQ